MLITRSDDGYFGLRRSLDGVFDKVASSWRDNAFENHGLTEDGKTVAPIIEAFVPKAFPLPQRKHPIFISLQHPSPPDAKSSRRAKKSNASATKSAKGSEDETHDVNFPSPSEKSVNLMLLPITRLETSSNFVFASFMVTFCHFNRAVFVHSI